MIFSLRRFAAKSSPSLSFASEPAYAHFPPKYEIPSHTLRALSPALVKDIFTRVPDVGILAVDLEIGCDVPGKIHAVPVRPASPRHEHQVDVRIIEEKIEPAGDVQLIVVSEGVVDVVIDG